ncbi:BlaI/MecI/CopY family transcriptional regulator [Streptomyces sp. NPDC005576]|uniref:BlaI/MecI/CopY family transcriptional regulator n=1 Tax=Streptomyces sp. NPDC005576 TaxID=3364726 RepID=UPI00368A1E64
MTRVWQWNRPVTVREVLEDLQRERSIAYTTVMTVMDNLHQKGWVRREVDGRAYRYTAVSTRAAYSAALMNEAWSRSDNPAAALVAFFGMMSAEQREALKDAVRIISPGPSGAAAVPTDPADTVGGTADDAEDTGEGGPEGGAEDGAKGSAEGSTEGSAEGRAEDVSADGASDVPADGTTGEGGR